MLRVFWFFRFVFRFVLVFRREFVGYWVDVGERIFLWDVWWLFVVLEYRFFVFDFSSVCRCRFFGRFLLSGE